MKDKKEKLVASAKKNPVKDANINQDTRNKVGFLIIGGALLILICAGIYWALKFPDAFGGKITDAKKFKEEYEVLNCKEDEKECNRISVSVDEDNKIKYASYEEVFKLLEDGTGVIYFGFPTCPWCRTMVPHLLNAAKEVGIDKIYYLNAQEDRDIKKLDDKNKVVTEKEGSENYYKLLEKMDSILDEYVLETKNGKEISTGEKRLYFPTIVVVKNGKIVASHIGTLESHTDPTKTLDEKDAAKLEKELREKFSKTMICDGAC